MLIESHRKLHRELGIPANYGGERKLPYYEEATDLIDVGPNLVGRIQRLVPAAAAKWQQMVETAAGSGVRLLIVSGFPQLRASGRADPQEDCSRPGD